MLPSISTLDELAAAQATEPSALWVLFFWAEFHPPSQPGGQLETLLTTLAGVHPTVRFAKARKCGAALIPYVDVNNVLQVEAEAADEVSEHFEITVVPTFVFLRVRGSVTSCLRVLAS